MKYTLPEFRELLRTYGASIGRDFDAVAIRNLYTMHLLDEPRLVIDRAIKHLDDVRRSAAKLAKLQAEQAAMRSERALNEEMARKRMNRTTKKHAELKQAILQQVKAGNRLISDLCFNLKKTRPTTMARLDELVDEGKLRLQRVPQVNGGLPLRTYWLPHEVMPELEAKVRSDYCGVCKKQTPRNKDHRCKPCRSKQTKAYYQIRKAQAAKTEVQA